MANQKVTERTAILGSAVDAANDLIPIVDVSATTAGSKKILVSQLFAVPSQTLVTPVLGVATATSINKVTLTAPATGATLTIANGKTLTASNTLTLTATDGSTLAIGTGGTLGSAAYTASGAYDAAGAAAAAQAASQPVDAELTALAGLTSAADKVPYFTGSGTAGVADFTATGRSVVAAASAAAATALFDAMVGDSGAGGTKGMVPAPAAGDAAANKFLKANGTWAAAGGGSVAVGDITGLGTGVATALAVNVGSAGAFVTFNGALGTPSSGTLTNATGLPAAGVVGTAAILGANTFTALQTVNPGQNKRFLNLSGSSTGEGLSFGFASTITLNDDGTTYNDVSRIGWNVGDGGADGGRLNTSRHATYWAHENYWFTGGRYFTETHLYHILANGTSYRPFSSIFPIDGGAGSGVGLNAASVTIGTWATSASAVFTFDTANNRINTVAGCLVGIGGAATTNRALKVYSGLTELLGPLVLGDYVQCASGTTINLGTGQGYMEFQNGGVQMTNAGTISNIPLTVKGMASQSGNLQNWRSSAAIVASTTPVGAFSACAATAIPSGGTAGVGYTFSSTANFGIFFGSSAPALSAAKGSLYLRSDGSGTTDRAYINTDGGTTWTALTTAG